MQDTDNVTTSESVDKESVVEPLSQLQEEQATVASNESVRFENIPWTTPRPRTSSAKCRELLAQIKNMTYIVEGWENLPQKNMV